MATTNPTTTSGGTLSSALGVEFSINTDEFISQLYISVPIGIILMVLYCIVRQISLPTWEVRRKYAEILMEEEMDDNMDDNDNADNNSNASDDLTESSRFRLPRFLSIITYPRISTGFLYWMWEVWRMDTNTFYKHAGFDALVFRLYLKGCMYICLASLPYALCILLPVYATADKNSTDVLTVLSINNIPTGDNRLYAAVIGCWIFSFIALYYLSRVYLAIAYATDQFLIGSNRLVEIDKLSWFNYRKMIDNIIEVNVNVAKAPIDFGDDMLSKVKGYVVKKPLVRHPSADEADDEIKDNQQNIVDDEVEDQDDDKYEVEDPETAELLSDNEYNSDTISLIKDSVPTIDRYTIMIKDLPTPFRDENTLFQFMNRLFPKKVAKVVIIPDVRELTRIEQEIRFHTKALQKLAIKHNFNMQTDLYNDNILPTIYEGTKCCGCCGEQINLITYHRTNRDALISKFNKLKNEGLGSTPTAFVTFNCLKAASQAISCPIRFGVSNLQIYKAPHPNDLFWDNLKFTTTELIPNNVVVTVAMFFLLIFWSIPVAAIQALANLESIFAAFNSNVYEYFDETTVSWMQGSLTVLILDLWLQLIPIIVTLLTKFQRKTHRGKLEILVLVKYYDCLVFMVLLVTVVTGTTVSTAGTFADVAENIVSSVSTIINSLADGLSNMSIYFLLYVLLNTFIWLPLELYRPAYHFAIRFNLPEPNRFNYSVWFAKTMLILTIVLTYGVMNPIMWILGLIYFIFAIFVHTYNLSMNWVPEFETGAKQWPQIFGRIRFGFMISIFTLFGLMALKTAYIEGALLIPLAGFIWYITGSITLKFRPVFNAPSLTSATDKDKQINIVINKGKKNGIQQFDIKDPQKKLDQAYLPPIMRKTYPSYNKRTASISGKSSKKKKKSKKKGGGGAAADNNDDNRLSIGGVSDDNQSGQDIVNNDDVMINEYDSYQNGNL